MKRKLNYCGECGSKLKNINEGIVTVRYCKKCKVYLPNEARYWVAFAEDTALVGGKMQ